MEDWKYLPPLIEPRFPQLFRQMELRELAMVTWQIWQGKGSQRETIEPFRSSMRARRSGSRFSWLGEDITCEKGTRYEFIKIRKRSELFYRTVNSLRVLLVRFHPSAHSVLLYFYVTADQDNFSSSKESLQYWWDVVFTSKWNSTGLEFKLLILQFVCLLSYWLPNMLYQKISSISFSNWKFTSKNHYELGH